MSASEKAAEIAKEAVADAAEEVAEQAVNFAEFARALNKTKVQFGLLGMVVGTTAGALVSFVIAYRRAELKYAKVAETEISEMREHYRNKVLALDAEAAKRPVSEIVRERGYTSVEVETAAPPMAVQPPSDVVEGETERTAPGDWQRKGPDIPVEPPKPVETRNVFEENEDAVPHEWDWHEERKNRSPDIPYVIHYDERYEIEGYSDVTLTYYTVDDVLCNERDEILDPDGEREALVGEKNLYRFGHGSNDPSIVYVRNDKLEILYEIIKSPHSYSEEVAGFAHHDSFRNLERMRARERDDAER